MAHQQPQQQQYDFITAISRLQEKIQQLSATKAAAAGPSSKLGVAWAFAKQNRGNVLLLLTFYSMSTASVVGSIMAQHRLQSDRLLEGKEIEQLQQQANRLEQRVEQQQQLLDSIAADIQQHSSSSSSWWGAAALRQRLLTRLQQQQGGQQQSQDQGGLARGGSSSSSRGGGGVTGQPGGSNDAGRHKQQQHQQQQEAPQAGEEFGVRVGPLGRGFLI